MVACSTYDLLTEKFEVKKGREVLEIGCGNGTFAHEIAQIAKRLLRVAQLRGQDGQKY